MTSKHIVRVIFVPMLAVFIGAMFFRVLSMKSVAQSQQSVNLTALSGEYAPEDVRGEFYGQQFLSTELPRSLAARQVMGATDAPKHIEVDLSTQRLYAYEGDEKVYDFLISSGKWGKTPTGTFRIWSKFRYAKMSGGSKELRTYYYLPNVPFVMFFGNDEVAPSRGFGIHGTYWHENFGHPMSHGCVNMKTEEAELIFNWTQPNIGDENSGRPTKEDPGTEIIIYGVAPRE